MAIYFVNRIAQANGKHEIHKSRCKRMPDEKNKIRLGDFYTSFAALRVAKKIYGKVNGCYYCCNECHTS